MYHVHPFSHACSTSNTLHKDYIKKDGLSSLISDFIIFFQGFFILSSTILSKNTLLPILHRRVFFHK